MINSGSTKASDNERSRGFWQVLAPCVSLSCLVSIAPAYANRADRAGADFDRNVLRQMRAEATNARHQHNLQNVSAPQQVVSTQANLVNNAQRHHHDHTRALNALVRNDAKTWQALDSGRTRNVNGSVELNLGSGTRSIVLGSNLFDGTSSQSVRLTEGGGDRTYSAGSKVTAAEYASILQILGGGSQSLRLDGQGRAAGGSMNLESLTNGDNMRVSALVVPEAVNVVGNFGSRSDFNLTGDLVNNGTITALSNRAGATRANISAHNLTNNAGGVITSIADSSAFPQYGQLQSSVDLKLKADETLSNYGNIASSGNLTLSAKTVTNESGNHSTALISAQNDVSIGTTSLVNSGSIASIQGNVNVVSPVGTLNIENTGGTIQAANAINVGDSANTAKFDTTINGGDWLSQSMNLYSGDGALKVNVGEVTGSVFGKAGTANVQAVSENLTIGLVTSGDPTIKNTGNVNLTSQTTSGGALAVLAGGDITIASNAVIDTSNNAGAGGSITLVAGSNWQLAAGIDSITGASLSGGDISGGIGNNIQFKSDGTTNAGNILIIAFSGTGSSKGHIALDSTTISAQGGAGGNNGDVTVIGGGGVEVKSIDALAAGTVAGTGNVVVSSFQPTVVNGPFQIIDASGAVNQGSFAPGALNFQTFDTTISGNIDAGGNVQVQSADALGVKHITAGGALSLTAQSQIELNEDLKAPGGIAIVAGTNVSSINTGNVMDIDTSSNTADGGDVTIVAGAAFTQTATSITINGQSPNGGFLDFDNNGLLGNLDTRSSAANGSGGDVTLVAYAGTGPLGNVFTNFTNTVITTGGSGTGANGNVTAVAGLTTAFTALGIRGSIDTTGGSTAGTGNVTLLGATPSFGAVISKNNGGITSGDFKSTNIQQNSNGFIDDITVGNGANITIHTGDFLELRSYTGGIGSSLEVVSDKSSANFSAGAGIHMGSVAVVTGTFITFFGDVIAPGGILMVAGTDIQATGSGQTLSAASAISDGGNISLIAGAAHTVPSGGQVTVTGASTRGGMVDLDFGDVAALNVSSSAAGGNAGNITVVSFDGSDDSGEIFFDSNTVLTANGNGSGARGAIVMVAGTNSAAGGITLAGGVTFGAGLFSTGSVTLQTANPVVPVTLSETTGGIVTGDFRNGTRAPSDILVGNITIPGGTIDLGSGDDLKTGVLDVSGGTIGDGGSINIVTDGAETLDLGNTTGNNAIGLILAKGGTTSGNAGSVTVVANGAGGIFADVYDPIGVTEGNGGTNVVRATNGNLTLNLANFDVVAGTSTATAHNGGFAFIEADTVVGSISIFGNGSAGGLGGSFFLTTNGSDVNLGAGANQVEIQPGFNNANLTSNNGFDINVTPGGGFVAPFINMQSTGDVSISSGVTATNALSIDAAGTLTVNNPINGSISVGLTAPILVNNSSITGSGISVQSPVGLGLTLQGSGSFNSTAGGTVFTASSGNMVLQGTQNFSGNTFFNALNSLNSTITLTNASTYTGTNRMEVNTYTFNEFGTMIGNPKVVNTTLFYTIANGAGNVVLTGDLIFTGRNMAIIASGDIMTSGASNINLSNIAGDGGSLLLLAGYDITPTPLSQTTTAVSLTVTGPSTAGGSINLGSVNINLSGNGGDSGSLAALASKGSVSLGGIDTTAVGGGDGGSVLIVGQNGVSVGNINSGASGGGVSGNVTLAVATPTTTGAVQVTNGNLDSGSFAFGATTNGDMNLAGISSPGAAVTLRGANTSAFGINQGAGTVVAQTLDVGVKAGAGLLAGDVASLSVQGDGALNYVQQSGNDLTLASVNGGGLALSVTALGRIILTPTSITSVNNVTLKGTGAAGQDAVVLAAPITAGASIDLRAFSGNLTINQSLTAPISVSAKADSGDVSVSAGATVNGGDLTLDSGANLTIAGNITNATTVSLASSDDLLSTDITGSIGNPADLSLKSTNGSVGGITAFSTGAANLQIQALNGSANVVATNANAFLLLGTALDFNLTASGALTITGPVSTTGAGALAGAINITTGGVLTLSNGSSVVGTSNGDVNLVMNGTGTLAIGNNVNISSTEGDVVINNNDIDKKTGFITIADGVTIKGSATTLGAGEVYIVTGGVPATPVLGKPLKKGVTINVTPPGQVFFGKKGITAKKQTNILLQALGRNLVFNTSANGKQSKKNIVLSSNVSITADPPGDVFVPTDRVRTAPASFIQPLGSNGGGGSEQAAAADLGLTPVLSGTTSSTVLMTETAPAAINPPLLPGATWGAVSGIESEGTLYTPVADTTVKTSVGQISIAKDSAVFVISGAHGTSVYNLHDTKRGAVRLSFGGKELSLSPGRHVTISARRAESFASINPAESILHRGVSRIVTASGVNVFTSEFAHHSAVQSVPSLRAIVQSKNAQNVRLSGKLVKTAAVLLQLGGMDGFEQHLHPYVTAQR